MKRVVKRVQGAFYMEVLVAVAIVALGFGLVTPGGIPPDPGAGDAAVGVVD